MDTETAKSVFVLISSGLTLAEIHKHFQDYSDQIDSAVMLLMSNGGVDLDGLTELAKTFCELIQIKDSKCREEDFDAAANARQREVEIHRKLKLPKPYHALISNEWHLARNLAHLQTQLANFNQIG